MLSEEHQKTVHDRSGFINPVLIVMDDGTHYLGEITKMRISVTQQFAVTFPQPVDRKGGPAAVQEGSVVIAATNDTATVEPNPADPTNPFSALVKGKRIQKSDGTEVASVAISADADLGEGVRTISKSFALEVTAAEAAGFGGDPVFGEVTEQE